MEINKYLIKTIKSIVKLVFNKNLCKNFSPLINEFEIDFEIQLTKYQELLINLFSDNVLVRVVLDEKKPKKIFITYEIKNTTPKLVFSLLLKVKKILETIKD